ncbi:toxin-antitoxin system HicB family antitoxin [Endozoicomonas sp. 4G]|uniref:toxin-antitoxin system HicB family antitoxin n=1 Tax=Endozoicomonas sp. 4G TaxID=2872754 RepID=UPI002078ADD2|nr:toxin-antitoxin system HicB family antitoxin [Endozoicomonas sp. 4G]
MLETGVPFRLISCWKRLALAIDTIEVTAECLSAKGKAMPTPYEPANEYSGRVTLRLPKTLHRSLSEGAEQEGISLNQYLVNVLSYQSGYNAGYQNITGYRTQASTSSEPVGKPNLKLVQSRETLLPKAKVGWH